LKSVPLLRWVLLIFLAAENAKAGAAVAIGPHNQFAVSYGGPIKQVKERALAQARRRYGQNVRILAATDVTGYGSMAVARVANGNWIMSVSLGNRSASEADTHAIQQCRKAGGIKPQVKWGFWG
jgi:hypothetical protein